MMKNQQKIKTSKGYNPTPGVHDKFVSNFEHAILRIESCIHGLQ